MLRSLLGVPAFALALAFAAPAGAQPAPTPDFAASRAPVFGYRVVHAYPHDTQAFTEGLFFHDGDLYESTGFEGRSTIRRVKLETGEVLQSRALDARYFGEGIVAWKDRLVELTWRGNVGFVYDLKTFAPRGEFHYPGEGWALTTDGRRLIMSDGTDELRWLDPDTLEETGRLAVTDDGRPVANLNELEWVKGEILANVWETDRIARIDPASGRVTGWIDLANILGVPHQEGAPGQPDVLNGIAYDAARDRLFVTGKYWPRLYQIALVPPEETARLRGGAASGKPR